MRRSRLTWTIVVVSATALLAVAAVLLPAGCASKPRVSEAARPGSGIAEYRQVATRADKAVESTLRALDTVNAETNRCSPETVSNLCAEVCRLQVDSLQVRARSEVLQARGDDYFEHWHQKMAHVKDPEVRALAEKNRSRLQEDFVELKRLSHEGREAFHPFMANLRKLRNALEQDPASVSSGPAQEWLRKAKENGERVEHCLSGIEGQLDSMKSMITPAGKAERDGKEA